MGRTLRKQQFHLCAHAYIKGGRHLRPPLSEYLSDPAYSSVAFDTGAVSLIHCYNISLIYNPIHDNSHNESGKNIEHGMLLQKYGGENNGDAQHKGGSAYFFAGGKPLIMKDSQVGADGIVHMDAWP